MSSVTVGTNTEKRKVLRPSSKPEKSTMFSGKWSFLVLSQWLDMGRYQKRCPDRNVDGMYVHTVNQCSGVEGNAQISVEGGKDRWKQCDVK